MKVRGAAFGFGGLFGFLISWGQFTDPDRIRQMLLLEDPYLYLMMFTSIAVSFLGARVLMRRRTRALLTGQLVRQTTQKPEPRHIAGAAIFALGWSLADSCPAPIAAQLSQGVMWSLFTIAGVFLGILGYFRWQERRVREPAAGTTAPA
ncbi:MAG: DUF6691 family protein [Thermoleophilaceae bacterium]